jgi:hypothetical protein
MLGERELRPVSAPVADPLAQPRFGAGNGPLVEWHRVDGRIPVVQQEQLESGDLHGNAEWVARRHDPRGERSSSDFR